MREETPGCTHARLPSKRSDVTDAATVRLHCSGRGRREHRERGGGAEAQGEEVREERGDGVERNQRASRDDFCFIHEGDSKSPPLLLLLSCTCWRWPRGRSWR